ncbi:phosphodiester glycosidase family protein [Leptolyngbya sp. NK1-12]|uniref:Phosphodiester glycosidase family protein n=1 Tax=Leptolyngbya sp. NK1-12 TaxID=2547451 RepID=A0AA96WGJ5_9CYAN|nr:phosphodiester glycosidase family protein [Leptolyngbya sp. NK1-12]WNZ24215.1 phosphodiester glycosidase family protein [Leptolyngbya sp. NK1-12]
MSKTVLLGLIGAGVVGLAGCAVQSSPSPLMASSPVVNRSAELHYTVTSLPTSEVHVLRIPASAYQVVPAVAPEIADLATFAQQYDAIAVLNGGFFDPQNQKSTSYVTIQGQQVADPSQNERLVNNPDLIPYMDQILNRSELRRYRCTQNLRYAIALHRDPIPTNCELLDALGAGPQLLPELTSELEGFTATDATGTVIRDALGSRQPNARTAVGLTPDGDMLWVMAAQKPGVNPSGLSLSEMAEFLKSLGVTAALNLDGGSSSALFYEGTTVHGKLDAEGNPVRRPVKSVLVLRSAQNGQN